MRLETALYASRAGLDAHGRAIAVISDNVANTQTYGYRASRAEFSELVSDGVGSKNSEPFVSGTGATLSKVRQLNQAGEIEFTSRQLDVSIDGEGFFVLGDTADPRYTRAGNFSIAPDGTLVNSDGLPVLGTAGAAPTTPTEGEPTLVSLNLLNVNTNGSATTTAALSANLAATAKVTTVPANPQTFKEIGALASYVSTMTVFDSLGAGHDITLAYFKTAPNTWTAQAYVDGSEVGGTEGTPTQLGSNATLNFDGATGTLTAGAATITGAPAWGNGAAAGNFTLDFASFTQNANASQLTNVTQDGKGVGQIVGYEFAQNGELSAVLSSGTRIPIGTLQVAKFPNPEGLERLGSNMSRAPTEAGTASVGLGGTEGRGTLQGGSLERSSVDISNEFVNLVIMQRGYQANSQILNQANSMIRDTIGLIR